MVTLMRFNIFLVFILIFTYVLLKTYKHTKQNNIDELNIYINLGCFLSFVFIISLTIFPITTSLEKEPGFNLVPFSTILLFLSNGSLVSILANIFGNIVLFVPLGFYLYIRLNKNITKSLLLCMTLTVLVEGLQMLLPMRLTDVDDIILNTLGGIIGILISKIVFYKTTSKKALKKDI